MSKKRCLTGIKPTGSLHLGNYLGAIKPILELTDKVESYVFIADYHAITTLKDQKKLSQYNLEAAATWLALGLDPEKSVFYRQSDVPEIFELNWILSCLAPKGLLNRAHAYKAFVSENEANNRDLDENINLGLFSYPVLMSADILAMQAAVVPVGSDQRQHVEIARDIAELVNKLKRDVLTVPDLHIMDSVALIPGLDGHKMSKNYNNTIPIFGDSKAIRKRVMQIKTDSKDVNEPKDASTCIISQLYQHVVSKHDWVDIRASYEAGGVGYGHHKQAFFEALQRYFSKAQEAYVSWVEQPEEIEALLREGAKKARVESKKTLSALKEVLGL